MKKILALVLALVLVFSFASIAMAEVTMKFAGTTTADPALGEYQAMLMFEELVEKYSNGSIQCDVYPASQLGSNVEFSEGVAMGEIEAAICGYDGLGNYAPVANALCMPYLFTSNEDAMNKIFTDGPIKDALDAALAEINIKVIGYVNRPFRVVCNNVRPVKTPEDMKGLVLRSPTSPVNTAINSAMGASPVTIAWSEVYTSMSQGACDAVENAVTELVSINLQQQCKYISETNHTGGIIPIFVGKDWFDGLTAEQQEAVLRAGKEVTEWRTAKLQEEVDAAWAKFEAEGAEVLKAEDIDVAAFQEATKDVVKQFIERGDFTQEFYDALKG